MTATVTPTPRFRALDANGAPLAGGLLYSYAAGTTTPQATYVDQAGVTQNTNPVVLDANGEADVWFGSGLSYKLTLKDSTGVQLWSVDNLTDPSSTVLIALASTAAGNGAALIGYLAPFTGAVARTQQQKTAEFLSVLDFGADATGVADSTTAIQNALNTGKSIFFPDGTYLITSGLTFNADYQTVKGNGALSKILCSTGTTNNGVNMLTALGRTGCVVQGLYFENSGYGITFPAQGVYTGMGLGVAFINSHSCKVLDSYFHKCGGPGQGVCAVYFSSSTECLAQGNNIWECGNGINSDSWYYTNDNTTRSRNNSVVGNAIWNCYGAPIVCDISGSLLNEVGDTIIGNVCYANQYGIGATGVKITITGNIVNVNNYSSGGVGWDGIWATGREIIISDNIIVNAYKSGIVLQAKATGYPLGGAEMRDSVVRGNVIVWDSGIGTGGPDSHGIRVVNNSAANVVSGLIIEGNRIIRARTNGILLDGSAYTIYDVSIKGNTITNTGAEGILANNIYGAGLTVEGNTVKNCTNEGIKVTTTSRAIVSNNRCIANGKAGIYLSAVSRSIVSGNSCWDNGTSAANTYDGIYCTAVCSYTAVYGNQLGNLITANTRYGLNLDDASGAAYSVFGNNYGSAATGTFNSTVPGSVTRTLEGELGQREIWSNGAPVAGTWTRGDRVWNTVPSASGSMGWVCVTGGTPGTWKTFGTISA